jgi:2-dehydro-3-deoxyglucarate aldolase/4-hydroxy-2-oxoheptanedioate aldolase
MDLPANVFKRAIASGKVPVGTWLMSGAPSTAEALGCAGFDFLVVDMEHVPLDTADMIEILRAVAGTPAHAIVRPPWNDTVMVKRAMDAGAQSLLFPFVQNADEARRAVASTRYPPEGIRGVAATHRGSRYGTIPNYLKRANDEVCVIVQIETPPALEKLEEIAAVPGVDSIFVGPGTSPLQWDTSEISPMPRCRGGSQPRPRRAASWASLAASSGRRRKWWESFWTMDTRGSRSGPTWA